MGWGAGLVLVALQAISLCWQPRAAAAAGEGWLSPLLSPVINGACDSAECGKGRCKASLDHAFGFVCECDPGWTKFHLGDYLQFLPCIIPNCTLDYSCHQNGVTPAPAPPPQPPSNRSLLDPCEWSSCGKGTCVKTSTFGHRCDCNPGYDNLLNVTALPCLKECVLGADCERLGLRLPMGSQPPSSLSGSAPNKAATGSPGSLMWIFLLMVSLHPWQWFQGHRTQ